MSNYGMRVLLAMGALTVFVILAILVRGVIAGVFRVLWPGGGTWNAPRGAGKRRRL
jgi:hypothetical protein